MAIDWGRMAKGVATGYLSAKIANTEANDKLNADIIKAAGLKFHETTYPEWEKKQKLYEKDYKMVEAIHGKQVANYFGEKDLFGTGNGLNDVESILSKYNISKTELNKLDLSTFEDRETSRLEDIQGKERQIMELTTGSSKIGPATIKNQLEGFGEGTDTATETQPSNVEGAPIVPVQPDISTSVSTDLPESIFTKKADPVGVETKFNSISRAVNEQMGYGEPIYRADGSVTFNIANDLKTTSNAHIALASSITQQRDDINQLDAVSLAEQELFKQTVTPFNIIASSIEGAKYSSGSGGKPALIEGMGGQTIDAKTTMIGDQSVYDFVTEIYNNELLKDAGRVNRHVFKKFIENLPMNITYNGEKLSDVLANAHELQYFRNY